MKTKEKKKVWKFFPNILNYFIIPCFTISLFAVVIMNLSTPRGGMRSVFGISIVRIDSGSMVEKGFDVGNVVLMNKNFDKPLQKGSIIAFYNKKDNYDLSKYNISGVTADGSDLVLLSEFEGEVVKQVPQVSSRTSAQYWQDRNERITFHEIIDVYVSPDGIVFYQTQGSNPGASPDGLIRQDFVIAKYLHTPKVLKVIMSFSITGTGMIVLMFIPLSFIVGAEAYMAMKKIYAFRLEKKLFNRDISFKDEKVKEYKVRNLMSLPRKVYFWVTSEKSDKTEVFNFLYKTNEESDKKQIEEYELALKARKIFENKGPLEYFRFWHLTTKNYFDKKDIVKLKKMYEENILNIKNK